MTNLTNVIFDTIQNAKECKQEFGDNYEMYCSYLAQLRTTVDGECVRIQPIGLDRYTSLPFNEYLVTLSSVESTDDKVTTKVVCDTKEEAISIAMCRAGHWYTDLVSCNLTTNQSL